MAEDLSGTTIKGYELREQIGAGGFGAIYRAHQPAVDREVAIKVIHPQRVSKPGFTERFEIEAQTIARLEHPYIVPLYDFWHDDTGAYLVMRYIRGGSLRDYLDDHDTLDYDMLALVISEVADALAVAHAANVVHRDLKPGNILLDGKGHYYLADFGIAKNITQASGITSDEAILGSPDYLSPEQVLGEPITLKADIYSLGVVIFEALTGELPFPNLTPMQQMFHHAHRDLPIIYDLPSRIRVNVNEVIQTATAKNPEDRYESAEELSQALYKALKPALSRSTTMVSPVSVSPSTAEIDRAKMSEALQRADSDDDEDDSPPPRVGGRWIYGFGAMVLIAVIAAVVVLLSQPGGPFGAAPEATEVVSEAATDTPEPTATDEPTLTDEPTATPTDEPTPTSTLTPTATFDPAPRLQVRNASRSSVCGVYVASIFDDTDAWGINWLDDERVAFEEDTFNIPGLEQGSFRVLVEDCSRNVVAWQSGVEFVRGQETAFDVTDTSEWLEIENDSQVDICVMRLRIEGEFDWSPSLIADDLPIEPGFSRRFAVPEAEGRWESHIETCLGYAADLGPTDMTDGHEWFIDSNILR